MKLEDKQFTEKQAKRILAEAAEREARDYSEEERTINYSQLVQIAQESQIDPKYLKTSTKQLIKEVGGLEKIARKKMYERVKNWGLDFLRGYFIIPNQAKRFLEALGGDDFAYFMNIGVPSVIGTVAYALSINKIGEIDSHFQPYLIALTALAGITNIGSGIYEWYRHEKDKLVKEMNGESNS